MRFFNPQCTTKELCPDDPLPLPLPEPEPEPEIPDIPDIPDIPNIPPGGEIP